MLIDDGKGYQRSQALGRIVIALAAAYLLALAAIVYAAFRLDAAGPDAHLPGESLFVTSGMDFAMDYGPMADGADVVSGRVAAAYAPVGGTMQVRPMAYLDDGAMWIRLKPHGVASPDGQVTLSMTDNRVRHARLVVERNGATETRDWTLDSPERRAGLSMRAPAFHFAASDLDGATVHLGVKSLSLLRSVLWIESRRAWEARTERMAAAPLFQSGALAMLAVILFSIGAMLREPDLLILGALSAAIMSILFGGAGFVQPLLLPERPALADLIAHVPKPLSVSLWLVLLARYLRLGAHAPAFNAILTIMAVLVAFQSVLIGLIIGYGLAIPFATTSALPFLAAFALGALALLWRSLAGDRRAWLFALCWSPLMFGQALRSLVVLFPTAANERLLSQDRLFDVALSIVLLAVAMIVDLQRRTAATRAAAESAELRSRLFAEVASQGFFETGPDGRIVASAGALAEKLGLSPGEAFADVLRRAASSGEAPPAIAAPAQDVEIGIGDGLWYAFSTAPRTGGGMIGVISDVTGRVARRREEGRMRTMVALGEMATGVAHEVNNLIHPIVNLARRLRTHHVSGVDGERLADLVIASGERAGRIVASVMANVSAPGAESPKTPLAIAVDNALDILDATIPLSIGRRRSIDASIDFQADAGEVLQTLANLTANAVRAMKGAGDLEYRLERVDGGVALALEDTGPGVSPAVIEGDFSGLSRNGDGAAGLGLSIVSGIAQGWGGRLRLSRRAGNGTRAEIILPANARE